MSESEDRDFLPLLVILESVGKIEIYVRGFEQAIDFFEHDDQAKFNATLLLLLNIGEQIGKLSEKFKIRNPHFPLNEIRGLRNRIAHDYIGIDYELVFDVAKDAIPAFKINLVLSIKSELANGRFDLAEMKAARQSPFYRHVNFNTLVE